MERLENEKGGEMKNGRLGKIILWQEKRLWLFKKIKIGFDNKWKTENRKYENASKSFFLITTFMCKTSVKNKEISENKGNSIRR